MCRQFLDGELARVAQVHRADHIIVRHKRYEPVDQVVHITKRARLLAIAINGDVFAAQGLHDEIRHHASIVGMHTRTIGVEQACHANVEAILAMVIEKQSFGAALAFVVARARADGIDVAPIIFGLRVHRRVAIHFRCRGLKNARLVRLAKPSMLIAPWTEVLVV